MTSSLLSFFLAVVLAYMGERSHWLYDARLRYPLRGYLEFAFVSPFAWLTLFGGYVLYRDSVDMALAHRREPPFSGLLKFLGRVPVSARAGALAIYLLLLIFGWPTWLPFVKRAPNAISFAGRAVLCQTPVLLVGGYFAWRGMFG